VTLTAFSPPKLLNRIGGDTATTTLGRTPALFRPWEWLALGGAAVASAGLLLWTSGSAALAAGFLAGLCLLVVAAILLRRLLPGAVSEAAATPDWTMLREAIDHDDVAIAVTDRAGRLICANDLYASWFGGFVTPPGLPVDAGAVEALKAAGRSAWRDGSGMAADLRVGALRFDAEIRRSGRSDDYLVWRFAAVTSVDLATEAARMIDGPAGLALGHAGLMVTLVGPDGRVRAANSAFAMRALGGNGAAGMAGRDVARLLRVDDAGTIYFEAEGEGATPVRLVQIPVAAADPASAVLLLLLDEEGGRSVERGAAQNYIETMLSLLPVGLGMVDRDGRFLFVNRAFCRAAGMAPGKVPRFPGDIVVTEDKGPLADMIRRHGVGQQAGGDMSVRLAAQPDEPISLRITGVRGLGEATVLLSLKDSSEESKLKRQVAQATKMQAVGQLAGGVAHDFNNILTAVLGACDLMLMRHTPGDGDYDDIQQIRSNANRAASLTRQLLAFSRQQTLRPQILQLPDVISEVSHLLKRLLGETTTLAVRHGRGLGAVRADPGQLEQVIVNLAVNGRDAMPGGGTLTIETFPVTATDVRAMGVEIMPPADYSALRVSDTGIGIPADVLPKIFEPFFTTKEVGKGTGLGLSTVYGIIKQSAGYIFADTLPGKGSSFTIYLPVHRDAGGKDKVAPALPPKRKREEWGTGTILLVEDEDMVRAVAERALTRAGYQVVTATQGEEGLERYAAHETIDLVVSDVVMPTMDGPTMVRQLRAARPLLPVLFMSGYAEEQLRESIGISDVDFLPKPFSVTQLTDAVADALARARGALVDG
jgi:two-component system, cell cycle sensor histidine kinase and response regulator CckA